MSHVLFGWEETNFTPTTCDDELIKEWCLSLHFDGWVWTVFFLSCVMKQDEQPAHAPITNQIQSFDLSCSSAEISNIWNISFSFCFDDWQRSERRHGVYCQIISHCLRLFNGRSSSCGWRGLRDRTALTSVWQEPSERVRWPSADRVDLPNMRGLGL